MLSLKITEEAEDAIAAVYCYSQQRWGAERAQHYLDTIEKTFELLCTRPDLGHKRQDIPDIYRAYPLGSHIIIYRAEGDNLHIVALFHMSMDIMQRLTMLLGL